MTDWNEKSSDGTLVLAVLAGEGRAFHVIVDRYQAALRRVAYSRLGDMDLADDIVQESLLAAFKSLQTYDSKYSFRTWLWTITLNQCKRAAIRKQKTLREISTSGSSHAANHAQQASEQTPSSEDAPDRRILAKERTQLLESVLQQLPDAQADALRLRFFGQLKFQEVADAMNCSLSSAKNRVKTGLMKITELIQANPGLLESALPDVSDSSRESDSAIDKKSQG